MIRLQSMAFMLDDMSKPLDGLSEPALALLFLWSISGYFMILLPLLTGDMQAVKRRIIPHAVFGAAIFISIYVVDFLLT